MLIYVDRKIEKLLKYVFRNNSGLQGRYGRSNYGTLKQLSYEKCSFSSEKPSASEYNTYLLNSVNM